MTFWWRRWSEHSRSPSVQMPTVVVGEHLELDVPRALDELLEVDVGVLEARLGLARRAPEGVGDLGLRADDRASPARRRHPTP